LETKLITNDVLLTQLIPKLLEPEIQNAEKNPKLITDLVKRLFMNPIPQTNTLLVIIRAISRTIADHPLAPIWDFVTEKVQSLVYDELNEGRLQGIQCLIGQWRRLKSIQEFSVVSPNDIFRSFVQLRDIIIGIIRKAIDNKTVIIKESPAKYTAMLTNILKSLTGVFGLNDRCLVAALESAFFWLSQELQDEIVAERLCDPTGEKLYSHSQKVGH
jgi:hypothetical protein